MFIYALFVLSISDIMADYEQFVKLGKKPSEKDLVAVFRVKVPKWSTKKRAWGAVASESSVGTWSHLDTKKYKYVNSVSAWVFEANKDCLACMRVKILTVLYSKERRIVL